MNTPSNKTMKAGILVVDHDAQSLQETRGILEGEGFRVYTASDGQTALDEFKRQQPNLVILAAMLPKLHGFEVCKSIKQTAIGAHVPVIITTKLNKNERYKRQAMAKFKADDFLVKPLSQEKLLGLVRQHLERRPDGEAVVRTESARRTPEAGLERILEDTLAGLMREGVIITEGGRGKGAGKRSGSDGRARGSSSKDDGRGGADSVGKSDAAALRDPVWDPEEDDEDWEELDEESVVTRMPAALAEVDEDEIDRIVDGLDFFADDDGMREEAPARAIDSRQADAPAPASAKVEPPVRPESKPAPARTDADDERLVRRTVAVTPVEMVRRDQPAASAAKAAPEADSGRAPSKGVITGEIDSVDEGQQFGKYLLLKKIATGGMAEVFRAKQIGVEGFEKLVALKRILPHLTDNEEFIKMFIDEGKLAAQLTHTNIVQIYELGEVNHSYYIAMEYVHGKNLKQILHRAKQMNLPMTIEKAVTVASKICKALDYAHRKSDMGGTPLRLVHRDVSPQNVLISYEGEVKLVDFGIAKAASQASITRAGALKGKILYMSPEQAWGKTIDHRSDIYAVGNLLYEMVTGRKLFAGQTEVEILKKVRDPKIIPPSQHASDMPAELEKIILKALEIDPEKRYQDASSMKRALDKYVFKRKVALGALNLGSYVQNLFQDEFQQDTAESLGQVDLPSVVLTDVDVEGEAPVEVEPEPAPPPSRTKTPDAPARAPAKSRRVVVEDAEEFPEPDTSDVFDRTALTPEGTPKWLYVMIAAVVLLVGLASYVVLAPRGAPELTPTQPETTTLQPAESTPLAALVPAETAVAPPDTSIEAPTVALASSQEPQVEPSPASVDSETDSTDSTDSVVPATISDEAQEPPLPMEADPVQEVAVPTAVPTPKPSNTPRPSATPRPTRTPKPTKPPVEEEPEAPVASDVAVAPTAKVASPAEVIYGEGTDSTAAPPAASSDQDKVIFKPAEPRPTEAAAPVQSGQPAEPEPTPIQPAVAPEAPPTAAPVVQPPSAPPSAPEARPTRVRENDLVEFPDTQLEFVDQGQVTVSPELRRKLKRVLGKETLSVRFFVRAEISMKGTVTRIESVLKGAKDVPQLASVLAPAELATLDDAFVAAAKGSRFKPLMKDNVKVRSVQTIFLQVRVP